MSSSQDFKKGDVVCHVSGGPDLCVTTVMDDADIIVCRWFDERETTFKMDTFSNVELRMRRKFQYPEDFKGSA